MVTDAIFGGLAFKAGIAPGMKIAAVNGRVFTPEILDDAVKSSKSNSRPIALLVIANDYYKTCSIDYHDGVRYPHLIRLAGKSDDLESLLKPEAR
jgi:predicted metalloprotease with PDZ domain